MSLYQWLKPKGSNGFGYGSTAEEVTAGVSLAGKTVLVTGCNSGLGQETARVLALRGARVLGTARSVEKAQAALGDAKNAFACELSEPSSVRACVAAIEQDGAVLDAIICNAGIMALPQLELKHGLELQFLTNHIGHFILVTGLLPRLAPEGRIVMLSSAAHGRAPPAGVELDNLSGERGYAPFSAYGQSKIANLLFAKELARRLAGTKQTANAVHPGVIPTNLARHMNPMVKVALDIGARLALKTVPQGAATSCYVAVHPGAASTSGAYFADCNVTSARKDADDPVLARKLWDASEAIAARL